MPAAAFALCAAQAGAVPSPVPSPSSAGPSASPSPSPRPSPRRVIVWCDRAPFYVWPAQAGAPAPASYPPARTGDSFYVVGPATLAPNGANLSETTIDVVEPWGSGVHYWIATACIT